MAQVPGTAAAQETHAEASPTLSVLIAEIKAWEGRDMRADPQAAHQALLVLKTEIDARSDVPPEVRADLFTLIGTSLFNQQEYSESADWFARSAEIFREAGGPQDKLAETLHNRATLLRALNRFGEAETTMREALALRRALYGERHVDVASSLFGLANVLFSQGRFEDALPIMREAVGLQRDLAPDDHQRLVQRISGLGAVLSESGRSQEAIALAREAERIGRQHLGPDHQSYASALHNLGLDLQAAGMHGQAIPVLRDALAARERIHGPDHPWTASTVSSLATSLETQGALEEAAILHERTLEVYSARQDMVGAMNIVRVMAAAANVSEARGDSLRADALMADALALADSDLPETHPMRVNAHIRHATILAQRGDREEALAIAERWAPVFTRTLIPEHRDRIYAEMLLAHLRQESGADAKELWPGADAGLDRIETKLGDPTASARERASQSETNRASVLLYLRMASAAGDSARLFRAAQLANLSDLSLTANPGARAPDNSPADTLHAALLDAAREETRLSQWRAASQADGDSAQAQAIARELDSAAAERARLESRLRAEHPLYLERIRPSVVTLEEAAGSLDAGEELLILVEARDFGLALRIGSDARLEAREFDAAAIMADVAALRRSVDSGGSVAFPLDAAARVHGALFAAGRSPEKLRVFGGRALATIPLGILVGTAEAGDLSRADWLVRRTAVTVAGNLGLQRGGAARRGSAIAPTRFAGIGGAELPEAGEAPRRIAALFRSGVPDAATIAGLPTLPAASRELQDLAAFFGDTESVLLIGRDAAEEAFKQADFSKVDVMAFATHGLVAGEVAGLWEPALLLGTSGADSGQDGLLGASEIARLDLAADWVILSACNTAAGFDGSAPVFSGLATAFAEAGARNLLLSHWRVRDDAAARMSVETIRGAAAGLDRAEALRRAQVALIEDDSVEGGSHPAIWAPFVLVAN